MSIKYLNVVLVAACFGIVYTLTHLAHEGARLERQVEQLTRDLIPEPGYDPRGAAVVVTTSYYTADGHLVGRRVAAHAATVERSGGHWAWHTSSDGRPYQQTLADVLAAPTPGRGRWARFPERWEWVPEDGGAGGVPDGVTVTNTDGTLHLQGGASLTTTDSSPSTCGCRGGHK